MSRSNSAIIYLVIALLVLLTGAWGLSRAGILSTTSGSQPASTGNNDSNEAASASGNSSAANSEENSTSDQPESAANSLVTETVSSDSPPPVSVSLPSNPSTAAQIRARDKLLVGVRDDFEPFGYKDENGQLVGMDIDLGKELAKRWLGDENKVEFVIVNATNRIPKLSSGEIDILLAASEKNRDREEFVDYSQAYFAYNDYLVVRPDTVINGLRGLQDSAIGAIADTYPAEEASEVIKESGVNVELKLYPDVDTAIAALNAKEINAVVMDDETYDEVIEAEDAQYPDLRIAAEPLEVELFSILVRQNDSGLRALIDYSLHQMARDGAYAEIFERWHEEEPLTMPQVEAEDSLELASLSIEFMEPELSRIDQIIERKKLTAGVVVGTVPYVVETDDGKLDGLDVNLLEELAGHWFADKEAVELIVGTEAELLQQLSAGELDLVVGGLSIDYKQIGIVDYSQAYAGPPLFPKYLSIALPQNDSRFRDQVNYVIQDLASHGELKAIYEKWFGKGTLLFHPEIVAGSEEYEITSDAANDHHAQLESTRQGFVESAVGRIKQRDNQLIAGVRFDAKPFGFTDESGKVAGFDVDLLSEMAKTWGVTVTFVNVQSNSAKDILLSGDVDIAATAATIDRGDLAEIDYSQSYFLGGNGLLVRRYAGITGIVDLDGKNVGIVDSGDSIDEVSAYAEAKKVTLNLVPFNEFKSMIEALKAEQVDAIVGDIALLKDAVIADTELAVAGPALTQEPVGFLLPPGDTSFKSLVDSTLQVMKQNGVYDTIFSKWFGSDTLLYDLEIYPGEWPYTFEDTPTALDAPVRSKVEEILLKKKIVLGTKFDAAPFGFLDETGQVVGFDVDLAREFAARWLGNANAIQPVRVTSDNRIQMLVSGEVDLVIASMTHTWERSALVDFSQSYVIDGQRLLVRKSDVISNVADLDGRSVAIVVGSTNEENLLSIAQAEGITFTTVPFQEYPQAVAAVKAGQVDALTAEELSLVEFAAKDDELMVVGERITAKPQAIGVPKYDKRFRDLVNFTLQEMERDGSYQRIFNKWFGKVVEPPKIEIWDGNNYMRAVNLVPMRNIPAGEFTMGNESGFPDEGPQRKVNLSEYYIDQYEVTNRQYAACVEAGECKVPSIPRSVNFASYYGESDFGNYPAIWVTWQDAAAYCAFVGKRLPTEAEWEKAARGSEGNVFPWGASTPDKQTNYNYVEKDVTAVGRYPEDVSVYGVYDMAGNVREWVADWYQWDYYQSSPLENPQGPRNGVTKVLRGGGWNDTDDQLRLTIRKNFLAESFDSNLGFRCASSTFPPVITRVNN